MANYTPEILLKVKFDLDKKTPADVANMIQNMNREGVKATPFAGVAESAKKAKAELTPLEAQINTMLSQLAGKQNEIHAFRALGQDVSVAQGEVRGLQRELASLYAGNLVELSPEVQRKLNGAVRELEKMEIASQKATASFNPLEDKLKTILRDIESQKSQANALSLLGKDASQATAKAEELRQKLGEVYLASSQDISDGLTRRVASALKDIELPKDASIAKALDIEKAKAEISSLAQSFVPQMDKIKGGFSSIGNVLRGISAGGGVFGTLAKGVLSLINPLGLATVAVGALGFSLRHISQEVQDAERALGAFLGDPEGAEALIASMGELEQITGQSKLQMAGIASQLIAFDDNINSVDDATEAMKRFTIATGNNKEALSQIPELMKRMSEKGYGFDAGIMGDVTKNLGKNFSDSMKVFVNQGMSNIDAFNKALKEGYGEADKLNDRLKELGAPTTSRLAVQWGNFKENWSNWLAPLVDIVAYITEKTLLLVNLTMEGFTEIAHGAINTIIGAKDAWNSLINDTLSGNWEGMGERASKAFWKPFEQYDTSKAIFKESDEEKLFKSQIKEAGNLLNQIKELNQEIERGKILKLDTSDAQKRLKDVQAQAKSLLLKVDPLKFAQDPSGNITNLLKSLGGAEGFGSSKAEKELTAIEQRYKEIFKNIEQSASEINLYESLGLSKELDESKTKLDNFKAELAGMGQEDILNGDLLLSDEATTTVRDKIASALSGGADKANLAEKIVNPIVFALDETGNLFSSIANEGLLGGITGGLSAGQGIVTQLGQIMGDMFKSAPIVGGILGGVSSLFTGIVSLFGGVSEKKQKEIDDAYNRQIESINTVFEREKEVREKAIKDLQGALSAYQKAFEAGQLTASEYYDASNQIGDKINAEELALAKAQKLAELQREEASKKRDYDEENAKWFPDKKKLRKISSEIDELRNRQQKVQNATKISEVNMAKDGALQYVDKPTMFIAGEAGAEIVNVRPLKAGIDPSLAKFGSGSGETINNITINVSGYVGNEAQLGAELTRLIQNSISVNGERAMQRGR